MPDAEFGRDLTAEALRAQSKEFLIDKYPDLCELSVSAVNILHIPPTLAHSQKRIRRRVIRQQLATFLGHAEHVFVLHAKAFRNINQRLECSHHAGLNGLIAVSTHVRFLVKVQADAVRNKTD